MAKRKEAQAATDLMNEGDRFTMLYEFASRASELGYRGEVSVILVPHSPIRSKWGRTRLYFAHDAEEGSWNLAIERGRKRKRKWLGDCGAMWQGLALRRLDALFEVMKLALQDELNNARAETAAVTAALANMEEKQVGLEYGGVQHNAED